ncbi:hypothetical protein [Paenibacillus sp. sgz500958]|uniref:hypothetical protein n=1 Tax=Paenibacillus sp. sgz500958 TaxID=3242475 RepID=UPI0036D3FCA6
MKKLVNSILIAIMLLVTAFPLSAAAAGLNLSSVVSFSGFDTSMTVGEVSDFNVQITDWTVEGIMNFNYLPVSSDSSVVRVKAVGALYSQLEAVGPGTATITIDAGHGYEPYKETLTVYNPGEEPVDDTISEEDLNPMLNDLVDYADAITIIEPYETKAVEGFNKYLVVTNSNRKQAFTSLNTVVIPNYTKFVVELKKIIPQNEELAAVHKLYLDGAKLQLEGMQLMKTSLSKTTINRTQYTAARKKVVAGRTILEKAIKEIEAYGAKYSFSE